jgi:hemerythrin-like domain-containing protein
MLRNPNLIPLSRQHQHALALCVSIDRAFKMGKIDQTAWQEEIQQIFEQEIAIHFLAEEKELFPVVAARSPELKALVAELIAEHAVLRQYFDRANARNLDQIGLRDFAVTLARHIRKEESELFEGMQRIMDPTELDTIGTALDAALKDALKACRLPKRSGPLSQR